MAPLASRATLVHVAVRVGGAAVLGALGCLLSRAVADFPRTSAVHAAFLGGMGSGLALLPVAAERWRLARGASSARRDLAVALVTWAGAVLLFVPMVVQATYGAGVVEHGAVDAGTSRALREALAVLDDLKVYGALAVATASPLAWTVWAGLRLRPGLARGPAATALAAVLAGVPLLATDELSPTVKTAATVLLTCQAVIFFPLRRAALALTGEPDPAEVPA